MGILGLSKLLHERAPGSSKETEMKAYFGRRIAIDASMAIYQFVIAMRGFDDNGASVELTNANNEVTTHLNGLWLRTLRMLEEGLKPVYVFDGAAPDMKRDELDERRKKAEEARQELEKAKEEGDDEAMEKLSKRTVRVGRAQMEECKKLLTLMGVPFVQAAGEAEAQCVELVKGGKCWAVSTEDMDALTFGAPVLLRHLTFSDAKKRPVMEYQMANVLDRLGFTMDQFIDLCILLGCDYCNKITGIGPQKAFEGIRTHGTIEAFVATLDKTKFEVPENWQLDEVRKLFKAPAVHPADTITSLSYQAPDADGLRKFLVEEKLFNAERIERGIDKLNHALTQKKQGRIDDFFKVIPKAPSAATAGTGAGKRPTSTNPSAKDAGSAAKAHRVGNGVGSVKKAVKK